jgi:hypothetical protein
MPAYSAVARFGAQPAPAALRPVAAKTARTPSASAMLADRMPAEYCRVVGKFQL